MKRFAILVFCLLPWVSHGAGETPELLLDVSPEKAQALSDYNAVFLQENLYFSKRHRIVLADTELLLEGSEFTITPFDDVGPLLIIPERLKTSEDMVYVKAHIASSHEDEFNGLRIDYSAVIGLHAWDLYEPNEAVLSMHNRLTYSPYWRIDESNQPVLDTPPEGEFAVVGPPPTTPEEIERHKKIGSLKKRQFFSVSTTITSPDGIKYLLTPLRFTPKYSVIQELDAAKLDFVRIDAPLDGSDTRSEEERSKARAYEEFMAGLPKETGKIVREDVE